MKAERIGLKRIGLQKIGLPRIGVMGAGASMRPTEIVGISYAREIGSIPSAMGNGLLTSEKWAKVSTLKGNSVVWNQLNKTFTANTFLTNSSNRAYKGIMLDKAFSINHKLLATCKSTLTDKDGGIPDIEYRMYIGKGPGTFSQPSPKCSNGSTSYFFVTPDTDTQQAVGVRYDGTPTEGDTLLVENIYVYDLTQMFGAGNEPTTIEEFESRKPIGVTNDYNEGEIISYQQWGEKVVWNQLIKNHDFSKDENLYSYQNGTYTLENGVCTVTTVDDKNNGLMMKNYKRRDGHIVYTTVTYSGDAFTALWGNSTSIKIPQSDDITTYHKIFKIPVVSYTNNLNLFINKVASTFKLYKVTLYDFTEMFGEGNEPTTIEEFERRRPRNVTNEYNEGTEINGDIEIKTVGLNILDCNREIVRYTSGSPTINKTWDYNKVYYPCSNNGYVNGSSASDLTNIIVTSQLIQATCPAQYYGLAIPIQLVGGAEYDFTYTSKSGQVGIMYLNKEGQYVSTNHAINSTSRFTAEKDMQAVLMLVPTVTNQIVSITNPCLHLVQDGLVSQYKPYTSTTTSLPNVSLIKDADGNQLFPYGLCSAGSVYDEINETKAIKRVGVVDMGTLDWERGLYGENYLFIHNLVNSPMGVKLLTAPYYTENTVVSRANQPNKTIKASASERYITIKDDSYTDADSFKQAMQGVLLYYELAEPIEVEIDKWKAEYKVEQGGTEQIVSAKDTTNLKTDIIYGNKV